MSGSINFGISGVDTFGAVTGVDGVFQSVNRKSTCYNYTNYSPKDAIAELQFNAGAVARTDYVTRGKSKGVKYIIKVL